LTIILPLLLALAGAPIFGGAKPVPFNPNRVRGGEWGVAAVALAGPLTNFLIAFVAYGLWVAFGGGANGTWTMIAATAVSVNLGFFVFNIIPVPPLDGSRIFYALAPDFVRNFMNIIERYGIIVVFVVVFLFSQQIGVFMGSAINFFIGLFGGIFGA
jgi:Zn-dependent protease